MALKKLLILDAQNPYRIYALRRAIDWSSSLVIEKDSIASALMINGAFVSNGVKEMPFMLKL